jgi:hypothetical protein
MIFYFPTQLKFLQKISRNKHEIGMIFNFQRKIIHNSKRTNNDYYYFKKTY